MIQIDEYTQAYESYKEEWRYAHRDFHSNFVSWMEALFYMQVMDYLEDKEPDMLMREEFRLNCERIFEKDKELYEKAGLTYYDLYNSHDMQEILENRNNLFLNELDNDEQ